jgi:hypothetical protein
MKILSGIWTTGQPEERSELDHVLLWKTAELKGVSLYTAPAYLTEIDGEKTHGVAYAYSNGDDICGGFNAPEAPGETNIVSLEAFDVALGDCLEILAPATARRPVSREYALARA